MNFILHPSIVVFLYASGFYISIPNKNSLPVLIVIPVSKIFIPLLSESFLPCKQNQNFTSIKKIQL
jgi:hypothetical protein